MSSRRVGRGAERTLFPVNVWPPFVDALTLVVAAFVLLMLVALVAQKGLLGRLQASETELIRLREEKARIERRLGGLAALGGGTVEVADGKVVLQGEVLFASGADELRPGGRALMDKLARPLTSLLQSESGYMVMIGGHTDDRPLTPTARFSSNWDLSSARALAVARLLIAAGMPPGRIVTSGFGEHHPRSPNVEETGRQRNRRIEVLLIPIHAVVSP